MRGSYEGAAFFPGLADGRASGTFDVRAGFLEFEAEEARVQLPLDGLQLRLGGASDRLVFFTHPCQPEWSVYTSDRSILNDAELRSRKAIATQIARMRRERRRRYAVGAAVPLALVGMIAALFAAKEPLARAVADRVPPSVEVSLGETALAQLRSRETLLDDAQVQEPLERLAERLVAVVPSRAYRFRFHIADDDAVNAFALPGGPVVVDSGLILAADDADEVAGVLAHEIAHITLRHSLRQLVDTLGLYTLIQAVFGDVRGTSAILVGGGAQLLSLRFSREFEREADAEGWRYLVAAGIDPRGMIRFFERLQAQEARHSGEPGAPEVPAFLSSHPTTPQRIEQLEAKLERIPAGTRFEPIDVDFGAFRGALRHTLSARGKETDASQD